MKQKNKTGTTRSASHRLPYGTRVIITNDFNTWNMPIGTTGTVVNLDAVPVPYLGGGTRIVRRLKDEDFWDRWEEQWIRFDGVDVRVLQIRRADLAPILERGTK